MIGFDQLQRGLFGMANAPKAGTMAGHLGAAVVAGYFFGEDHPDLDEGVMAAVRRDQDRIAGGEESIWFDPKKVGITCRHCNEHDKFEKKEDRRKSLDEARNAHKKNAEIHNKGRQVHQTFHSVTA